MPEFKLMQHQADGVAFLESVDGVGALLWEPGVGKTGATAAWVDKLAQRKGEVRVLVVAPLTAADTWVLQPPSFMDSVVKARLLQGSTVKILGDIVRSGNWMSVPDTKVKADHTTGSSPNSRVTIIALSAGALSSFCDERTKTLKVIRAVRKFKPDVIVVDESHIIKSATSNISKALYQLWPLAPHRIILTGTVNPLNPLDCYGQWRFLAPWTFSDQYKEPWTKTPLRMSTKQIASIRPWAWGRFETRYGAFGGYKGKTLVDVNGATIDELHDRVAERSMVVTKADALDLPPTQDIDIHFSLNPAEAKAYTEMADDLITQMQDGSMVEAVNALAKMMKLRQIHSGFVKNTETDEVHVIGASLREAVREVVEVTLAGEQRLVVFAYFRRECELLADTLAKDKNATVELITGSTKANDRLAIRQRFADVSGNPKRTILVAQQRTMSLSVNELVTAQHAIYASRSERRDDEVQSRGRLDRNGQTKPVTFWNVFVPGLIGEIMRDSHQHKGNLEKALLDHVRQVAAGRVAVN